MAMKACVECKKEISTDCKKCPNCGKNNPFGKTPTWLIVVGVIVGLSILGKIVGDPKDGRNKSTSSSSSSATPTASEPAPAAEPAITVALNTLLGEYKDNEIRADAKFKDKFIKVSGKVDDVKKDILDNMYVTLGTGAQFEIPQIQCFLEDSELSKAASLSKGAMVTVQGRVDGLLMNVLVRECTIL